jgi:hypothetical protein
MQVERVDRVEFRDVDKIYADRFVARDRDRVFRIVMTHGIDGINLVLVVEIRIEGVHHHHQFLPLLVLRRAEQAGTRDGGLFGMPRRVGIDDKGAIHPFVNVPLQRECVAMIEMTPKWQRIEFIDELLAGIHQPGARNSVHARGMNTVKMHRVRV